MEYAAIILSRPPDDESLANAPTEERVFKSKEEALKTMKKWKECAPRMKMFATFEEALESAKNIVKPPEVEGPDQTDDSNGGKKAAPTEGCPYSGLKPQELKQLKDAINNENVEKFEELVASNPRYLMTPCDQPSILHSGTRSNGLHVAAQSGKLKMAELLLDHITGPSLMERMYPNDSEESRANRQEYLLDLYLNMPKKGDFDTPLHQASKWGHWPIVKFLVEFSSCDTARKNKEGLTPAEVACSRMGNSDQDVKSKILDLLSDRVYIPVYRASDNSMPGYVGEPWSPAHLNSSLTMMVEASSPSAAASPLLSSSPIPSSSNSLRPPLAHHGVNPKWSPLSPRIRSPFRGGNNNPESPLLVVMPPSFDSPDSVQNNLSTHHHSAVACPLTSPMVVQAFMGPVSPSQAEQIQAEWKKTTPVVKMLRLQDPEKGLERQGRDLAKKYNTSLKEFWPFLDSYCDLSSKEGLQLLENHLHDQSVQDRDLDQSPENGRSFCNNAVDDDSLGNLASDMANLNLANKTGEDSVVNDEEPRDNNNSSPKPKDVSMSVLNNKMSLADISNGNNNADASMTDGEPLSESTLWLKPRLNNSDLGDSSLDNSNYNQFRSRRSSGASSYKSALTSFEEYDDEEDEDDASVLTADEGSWIYMEGPVPSKTDLQVFSALEEQEVDPVKYPNLYVWKNKVATTPEVDRKTWKRNRIIAGNSASRRGKANVQPNRLVFDE